MGRLVRVSPKQQISWQEAMEYFVLFKRSQGLSERTIEDYRYHISHFFETAETSLGDYERLRLDVLRYFAESASFSPATFNMRLKKLKVFFSWATAEGIIPANPLAEVPKRKEDERPRNVEPEILEKLLSLPDKATFTGLRDYALLLLVLDTGIRPKEALSLTASDFNFRALEVTIPANAAKTRVSRTLPLSPVTCEAVRHLLMARHPEWTEQTPVFCTEDGKRMNHNAWDRRLQLYSERLNVKVRPYDLRHSFALLYLRNGGNAFSLQKMLGHTTLTMTKRYVALTQQDLKQQHILASPLNTLLPKRSRVRKVRNA